MSLSESLFDAITQNDIAKARRILESGQDPNQTNETGYFSALYLAVKNDNLAMTELLLEFGANQLGHIHLH